MKCSSVCREKELLKEKRRKRQELFQEQKVSVCHSKWFQIPSEAWTLSNPEFLVLQLHLPSYQGA